MMEILFDGTREGRDVLIIENDEGVSLDIKHPCGEVIRAWDGLENYYTADRLANMYIYALGEGNKAHCDDEYCQSNLSVNRENELLGG